MICSRMMTLKSNSKEVIELAHEEKADQRFSPLFTGLAGIAVGATAMYLSNRENRQRFMRRIEDMRTQVSQNLDELSRRVDAVREEARGRARSYSSEILDRAEDTTQEAKQKLEKTKEKI